MSCSSARRAPARPIWRSPSPRSGRNRHSVLFTSATAVIAALAKFETEGQLADRLLFHLKPKLLIIDETRLSVVRAPELAPVLSAGGALLRARQLADHHEISLSPMGHPIRRRGVGRRILDAYCTDNHARLVQGDSSRRKQKCEDGSSAHRRRCSWPSRRHTGARRERTLATEGVSLSDGRGQLALSLHNRNED